MKAWIAAAGICICLSPGTVSAANIDQYTNESDFTTALAGGAADLEELFDPAGPAVIDTNTGVILSGQYWDNLSGPATSTISLGGTEIYGFGGYFDLSSNNFGTGVVVSVNLTGGGGVQQVALLQAPYNGGSGFEQGFFGFTSDVAFTEIILSTTNSGGVMEHFSLDDLLFATTDPGGGGGTNPPPPPPGGEVPEPSTFVLMSIALTGLGAARFRRKR